MWEMFRGVLRFWLDRGVDGFRVDVAHGLIKEQGLPDKTSRESQAPLGDRGPFWDQDGVHEVYRDWRQGPRRLRARSDAVCRGVGPPLWRRWPGTCVRTKCTRRSTFGYLATAWDATSVTQTSSTSPWSAFGGVGGPSTWVLSNHDVVRHASRMGLTIANLKVNPPGLGPTITEQT